MMQIVDVMQTPAGSQSASVSINRKKDSGDLSLNGHLHMKFNFEPVRYCVCYTSLMIVFGLERWTVFYRWPKSDFAQ